MKGIIKGSLVTGLLAMCLMSNVYATDSNKIINKTILESEESSFVTSIQKEIEENDIKYKLSDYSKKEDEENSKVVTAYKKDVIKSNTKEAIISHFGDSLNYDDEEYSGTIALKDYEIKTISNGKYEAIDEKKINFSKYSKNDLDNIEKERVINLKDLVDYSEGQVVSKTLVQNELVSMTVFSFDKGEEISSHSAGGDAMVTVLDGKGRFTVGGKEYVLSEGETLIMPKGIPHAVFGLERFKMQLTVSF